MTVTIALGLALGLIGLGILGMLISGVQAVIRGKQDFKKIIMMLVPFVVFAITYGIFGVFSQAGVATMLIMMALMALGIVLSGVRGTFNF